MSSKMPVDCDICCEPFTKQVRKKIDCGNCDLKVCAACVKHYLLSKKDAHCMGCKMGWTDAFCDEVLGGFMHGTYRHHTKELLWEMEKARMPETMPAVERVIKLRKMKVEEREMSKKVEEARQIYNNLMDMQRELKRNIDNGNVDGSSKAEMEKKKKEFIRACPVAGCTGFLSSQWKCGVCETWTCKECMEIIGKDKEAEHTCNPDVLASAQLLKKETKPCPSCSAAIFKISGCDQMWCTQCKVPFSWKTGLKVSGTIHNPHYYQWQRQNGGNVQNPGAIACGGLPGWGMFSSIMKHFGVPNPKSKVKRFLRYYSEEYNMFQCYLSQHGVKSWGRKNTLSYVSDRTRRGRETDIPSGGLSIKIQRQPDRFYIIPPHKLRMQRWKMGEEYEYHLELNVPDIALDIFKLCNTLQQMHRAASHFENVELDKYRRLINRHANNDGETDRVLYILKEVTENSLKTKLMKQDRKKKKERAILDIFEVFNTVIGDAIRAIYNHYRTRDDGNLNFLKEQMDRIENVRQYANIELLKISKTYKQVVPLISITGYTYSYHWDYVKKEMNNGFESADLKEAFIRRKGYGEGEKMIYESPKILGEKYVFEPTEGLDLEILSNYRSAYKYNRRHRRY